MCFWHSAVVIPAVLVWLSVAEVPASEDASASCYDFAENVGVLSVVMTELKFRQVERQIFCANVVVSADYAALEQRPKRFDVIRMNLAAHILAGAMANRFVREANRVQMRVAAMLIGRYKVHRSADRFADKRLSVAASVLSIIWQTTLPLRLIAPMTPTLPEPSPPGVSDLQANTVRHLLPGSGA
jgi:hypothetical protein